MGCLKLTYEETPTLFLEDQAEKTEVFELQVWVNPERDFLGVGEEVQTGGGAVRAGTEDGANWNLYYASSTLGMFGFLKDNDSFWMGKNNRFYSKSLLYKDYWGASGKFVRGVQGYRASANIATSTASKLNTLGRKIGVIGVGVSILDGIRDGEITEGDILRIGISIFTVVSPIGWAYGLADLTTQIVTGTSITDRISNGVDKHLDVVNVSLWKH